MKKTWMRLLAGVLGGCCLFLTACKPDTTLQDGTYRAETKHYDSRGYKDFIEVTVKDAEIIDVRYDAEKEDGSLKTQDSKYRDDMAAVQETYPEKFSQDLVNQLLETRKPDSVDAIAGATYSSDNFNALLAALKPAMIEGSSNTVVIENLPER